MATRHGYAKRKPTKRKATIYHAWEAMKARCLNPKHPSFPLYGARGISVCDRWMMFDQFLLDMGATHKPGLWLERINNDLGYSPENCTWATPKDQSNNKRTPRGESHWRSALTESQVISLFQEVESGNTQASVARKYQVSAMCVNDIVHGRRWAHLNLRKAS